MTGYTIKLFFSALLLSYSSTSTAQTASTGDPYPEKPIKIVVPFAPGGGADFMGRLTSDMLTEALGKSVIVENKPGAASTIGSEYAIKSKPDGYTLLLNSGSYTVTPSFYKLNYDPVEDITPVIQLSEGPYMLAVSSKLPVKNVSELIEYIKKHPGKTSYSSSGLGGHLQVITEYFLGEADVTALHVPYKGTGPALTGLLSGDTQIMFAGPEQIMPHAKSGRINILAVSTKERVSIYPDIPTIAESGIPGFEAISWHGVSAPKGTSKEVIDKLNIILNKQLQFPKTAEKLNGFGVSPKGGEPKILSDLLRREIAVYAKVIKDKGIKINN